MAKSLAERLADHFARIAEELRDLADDATPPSPPPAQPPDLWDQVLKEREAALLWGISARQLRRKREAEDPVVQACLVKNYPGVLPRYSKRRILESLRDEPDPRVGRVPRIGRP